MNERKQLIDDEEDKPYLGKWVILVRGKPMRPSGDNQEAYSFQTQAEAKHTAFDCYGDMRGIEFVPSTRQLIRGDLDPF